MHFSCFGGVAGPPPAVEDWALSGKPFFSSWVQKLILLCGADELPLSTVHRWNNVAQKHPVGLSPVDGSARQSTSLDHEPGNPVGLLLLACRRG